MPSLSVIIPDPSSIFLISSLVFPARAAHSHFTLSFNNFTPTISFSFTILTGLPLIPLLSKNRNSQQLSLVLQTNLLNSSNDILSFKYLLSKHVGIIGISIFVIHKLFFLISLLVSKYIKKQESFNSIILVLSFNDMLFKFL